MNSYLTDLNQFYQHRTQSLWVGVDLEYDCFHHQVCTRVKTVNFTFPFLMILIYLIQLANEILLYFKSKNIKIIL